MKFLCPNCKAKYRIGPEKMAGRQAAKIRCRKCEYLIQISYRLNSDEFDVSASPPSLAAPAPAGAARGVAAGQSAMAAGALRARLAPSLEEASGSKKPTAAVPGLPGLGSPKSRSGAALLSDSTGLARRPLAPLPPPPAPPVAGASQGTSLSSESAPAGGAGPAASVPGGAPSSSSTQLGDQFRESIQAGGAVEELPREGWFVGVNGVPLGPIPLGDLRELAMAGHIDRRSLVWRDGQAEWRPLGKFPGLLRVIDEGAGPLPSARPEAAPTAPHAAGSQSNGANGHIATGFDVPRADAGERPSVWGDLDDDDDEDEQPTTVKGRVSMMPPNGAPSSVASLPPVSAPAGAAFATADPFGITSPGGAAPAPAVASAVTRAGASNHPISIISAMPEPMSEEPGALSSGRSRWYLVVVAIVFAFALGAIVTHLMRSSSSEASSDRSSQNAAPRAEATGEGDDDDETRAGPRELVAALRPAADVVAASDTTSADAPRGEGFQAGVLPAGLRGVRSPGASSRGAGLDAVAVQRTVRRYSPAVRRNCWPRALSTRVPGVPSSAKVTATITIEPNGQVQSVAVSGAPKGYPGLSRCVEGAVKGWQFPRAGAQTVTNVPFMFVG